MRPYFALAFLVFSITSLAAQTANPASVPGSSPSNGTASASASPLLPELDKLQGAASQTSTILQHMRIEKWKADGNSKQQAQSNADSIQRNLTAALPGMIIAVRSAPQDLNAQFRLYRNVNALYDVMNSLTESAGAFGAKTEFEGLAGQLEIIDSVRHNLGDSVDALTVSTQNELNQARSQLKSAQQQSAAAAAPPKTTVVDDNEPPKKSTASHKKKSTVPKSTTTPAPGPTPPNQ